MYLYISFNAAATSFLGDKDLRGPSAEIGCAVAINEHAVVGDFSFWKTNITYLPFGFRLQLQYKYNGKDTTADQSVGLGIDQSNNIQVCYWSPTQSKNKLI